MKYLSFSFLLIMATGLHAAAQEAPVYHTLPRYQTPVPYSDQRNWHITQNLGPTGARAWVLGLLGNSDESRELMIKSVEPGSPAEGVLRPYDFIIGAAVPPNTPAHQWDVEPQVKPFDADARMSLARAITWAESDKGGGRLKLIRYRDGSSETVVVTLPVMGTYAPEAPFSCPKTDRITRNAADFLARNMPPEGFFGLQGALNAMFLLAMDEPGYLDHVRRSACRMSINHTINDAGHETWRWGYQNMFLAEYYLATGDERVLPTIAEYCDVLARGQCNPGTWGHRAVPDFIPPGYGSMNQSGLVCFISMILGRQCGVPVDEKALANCISFYGSYAGLGGIPYGDHPPHAHPTCNGKNGSAAVAFNLLAADPAAQWFARMCASASDKEVEEGHTGNFFSQTWSPLGAGLSGAPNASSFWERYHSYRDMARRRDGSFVTQPLPHRREGDLGTGNYVRKGPMWSTGGFALGYLAQTERLAVLNRKQSVFAADVPDALKPALKWYHEKKFENAVTAAEKLATSRDSTTRSLARQLEAIARHNIASIGLTLADMRKNLEMGDLYTLEAQLQAIESMIEADDGRLRELRAAVEDPASAEILAIGRLYHRWATGDFGLSGPSGFGIFAPQAQYNQKAYNELKRIVERGKGGYREMAAAYVEKHPFLEVTPNVSLFAPEFGSETDAAQEKAPAWRLLAADQEPGHGWGSDTYDDSSWKETALPTAEMTRGESRYLRRAFTVADPEAVNDLWLETSIKGDLRVFLNDTLIMDTMFNSWPKTWLILLKPSSKELLRQGENVLALEVGHSADEGDFALDLKTTTWQN